MHILFISDNFPPEVNAPASRTFEHCREWVASGHRVTVLTCAPNFPQGIVYPGFRNRLWQQEDVAGIRVIRVWSYITANEGFLKRILDYVSFAVAAFLASFFIRRADILVGTSPQFFVACATYAISLVKRRPWIFELRDIWPESIRVVAGNRNRRLLDFLEKVELFLYRKANAIVAVTHAFKANLVGRGIADGKIHVVTNGVDIAQFKPAGKDPALVERLGLTGKFVIGYIGTHGMAHALDTLIGAARALAEDARGTDVAFLMLGEGAEKEDLKAQAAALGLANIQFLDSVPKSDVARYWSLLDVAVIHLRRTDLFKTVIPSKIFECMAMGIPMLHGVEGESAEIVVRHEVGLLFQPENVSELVEKALILAEKDELRAVLAANGVPAAKLYTRTALANEMLQILERYAARS